MPAFLATLSLLLAAQHAAATTPAWQCGQLVDYYAKARTECAPASCNAAQRNLGGDVLVLDTKSYGTKSCQGCNLDIPSTCCSTCKDTNGCNAWVVCTKREGCGSGCQAYAKRFKGPIAYGSKLPHVFWGNWGGCNGDKWPFGMCSLKIVKDVKNPPVTSTNPSDGWVSGIVPKVAADPRCLADLSQKSCKACLAAKDPAKCIACIKAANTLDGTDKCVTCASLASATAKDACTRCAASTSNYDCSQCLDADCSDTDCMNAQLANRAKAPNLASVQQCYECIAAAEKAAGGTALAKDKSAAPFSATANVCPRCFESWNVPKANRAACITGVTAAGVSAAAAAGFPACYGSGVEDKAKCMACVKKARNAADASGCGACSNANNVPASYTDACHKCVLAAIDDGAKSYCSNLDRDTNQAAVSMLYKCLASAKGPDAPSACWQCYRAGDNASAGKCFECMSKVQPSNGIHCSHCWVPSKMAAKATGGQSQAQKCEQCVVGKDKAKGDAASCWM